MSRRSKKGKSKKNGDTAGGSSAIDSAHDDASSDLDDDFDRKPSKSELALIGFAVTFVTAGSIAALLPDSFFVTPDSVSQNQFVSLVSQAQQQLVFRFLIVGFLTGLPAALVVSCYLHFTTARGGKG